MMNTTFKFQIWPTEYREITQHFGANPKNYAQFGLPGHEGIDIRAPHGSKVFCVAPGTINQVHTNGNNHNYGTHVRVDHQDGYQTIYAHLTEVLVTEGQQVNGGDVLGLADNTGNSFGDHLHLTLKKKGVTYQNWPYNIIDPTPFLLPLLGWQKPIGPFVGGWVLTNSIVLSNNLAQANPDGITLRIDPQNSAFVPGGTIMIVSSSGVEVRDFTPVQVPRAAIGLEVADYPSIPSSEPPNTITTIEGWAWKAFLHRFDNQAMVKTQYGINFRTKPNKQSNNIGVLRAYSTVFILGKEENGYQLVRARRADFVGPVELPTKPPEPFQDILADLPADVYLGWVQTQFITQEGSYAIVRHRGAYMRGKPEVAAGFVGMIKGDATVTIAGQEKAGYTPVLANEDALTNLSSTPRFMVELPELIPGNQLPSMPPAITVQGTTPGWVLTHDITVQGETGIAGSYGLNLRELPRRETAVTGFIPPHAEVLVTGSSLGEYTPVRVDEEIVQPAPQEDPDPTSYGKARIGLHASADPDISDQEHQEFALLRPGIIKLLSFHSTEDIRRLAEAHPNASWIVRAFLNFGGRSISPTQFVTDTLSDVKRTLDVLGDKDVVIELHNEPNLVAEGMGSSWEDGRSFANWWLDVLKRYQTALPDMRFLYPGLSPGSSVSNVKADHIQFLEASRTAVDAADGLGIHLYWSNVYPMEKSLDVLDDYIARVRHKPIWITEASNNKAGPTPQQKAQQYLQFWKELQQRPLVQGVTFFVASASDPAFANEVWVSKGIAQIIGQR